MFLPNAPHSDRRLPISWVGHAASSSFSRSRGRKINFLLLISRQGKTRLTKWYQTYSAKVREQGRESKQAATFVGMHDRLLWLSMTAWSRPFRLVWSVASEPRLLCSRRALLPSRGFKESNPPSATYQKFVVVYFVVILLGLPVTSRFEIVRQFRVHESAKSHPEDDSAVSMGAARCEAHPFLSFAVGAHTIVDAVIDCP